MSDITAEAAQIIVSKALLADGSLSVSDLILQELLNPPTTEQLAVERAEREAIWDEKTAAGWVGIVDFENGAAADWQPAKRGEWVDRWVPPLAWILYIAARRSFNTAEQALERSAEVPS